MRKPNPWPYLLLLALLAGAAPLLGGCDRDNHSPGTTWSDRGNDSLSLPGPGAGAPAGWVGRGAAHPR
jgi:hypothetical protein